MPWLTQHGEVAMWAENEGSRRERDEGGGWREEKHVGRRADG